MTLCHVYVGNYVRLTTIFVAKPKDENQRPKTLPDFESAVSDNTVPHAFVRTQQPPSQQWMWPLPLRLLYVQTIASLYLEDSVVWHY